MNKSLKNFCTPFLKEEAEEAKEEEGDRGRVVK